MTRTILVTRPPRDCVQLQAMVERCGLTVLPYPVFRLEDVDDLAGWTAVADRAATLGWSVMASPRAPGRFARQCADRNLGKLLALPVAAVGDSTADACRHAGLEPEIIGPGTGLGLAERLIERWSPPTTAVFACGHHRRPELPDALAAAGHHLLPVTVYRMRPTPPDELPELEPGLAAVVLTSPRAARLYLDGVGGRPPRCPHWALGPTTRDAARTLGIDCRIPPEPNLTSLAEELCRS